MGVGRHDDDVDDGEEEGGAKEREKEEGLERGRRVERAGRIRGMVTMTKEEPRSNKQEKEVSEKCDSVTGFRTLASLQNTGNRAFS